ncbi:zinc finger protein ZPR1-like [Sycon ciliatum]|uniref:zinc finger protein ZPR1-like n=1 Tax=Sycon ciliatum TaxID=27933 RepID=UPI0031F70C93
MAAEEQSDNKPLFRNIDADDETEQVTVESLCLGCQENGTTRLLLTKIPYFKEIVISSFECPHCGFANKEIQSAGEIQLQGCVWTLDVKSTEDLGRQVVKSDSASLHIPEVDFQVPSQSQPGIFTTVEGLVQRAVDGLEQDQVLRRIQQPELAEKIDEFVVKLQKLLTGDEQFQVILDDPSGNSFIEFLNPPAPDPLLKKSEYTRSKEQNEMLNISSPETVADVPSGAEDLSSTAGSSKERGTADSIGDEEILSFPSNCPNCQSPVENLMKPVDIPLFKQVIIMAVKCDRCGFSSNEVKSAGGIEPKGVRISLEMSEEADLSRDVLIAETASLCIPQLELSVDSFAASGSFTTLEGVLTNMKDQLTKVHALSLGDSSDAGRADKLKDFLGEMDSIISGTRFVTIQIDDPAGNSYVQNLFAPDPDPGLTVERYERSQEQNEELGFTQLMDENKLAAVDESEESSTS